MEGAVFLDPHFSVFTGPAPPRLCRSRTVDGVAPGMVFRSFQHRDPVDNSRITDADFIISADFMVVQASERVSAAVVIRSLQQIKEGDRVVLMTDVSDLLNNRTVMEKNLDGKGKSGNELDELDQLDTSEGLGADEAKELKQLETYKGGSSTSGDTEAPPPAEEPPPPEDAPPPENGDPEAAPPPDASGSAQELEAAAQTNCSTAAGRRPPPHGESHHRRTTPPPARVSLGPGNMKFPVEKVVLGPESVAQSVFVRRAVLPDFRETLAEDASLGLAIVGTPTHPKSRQFCGNPSPRSSPFDVIWLCIGVDSEAHAAALDSGLRTVAVVAGGLDLLPRELRTPDADLEAGGLIIQVTAPNLSVSQ